MFKNSKCLPAVQRCQTLDSEYPGTAASVNVCNSNEHVSVLQNSNLEISVNLRSSGYVDSVLGAHVKWYHNTLSLSFSV